MKRVNVDMIVADQVEQKDFTDAGVWEILDWKEEHMSRNHVDAIIKEVKEKEKQLKTKHLGSSFLADNSFESLKQGAVWLVDGVWQIIKGLAKLSTWALVVIVQGIIMMAKWSFSSYKKDKIKKTEEKINGGKQNGKSNKSN
jgi:hypothetical protein